MQDHTRKTLHSIDWYHTYTTTCTHRNIYSTVFVKSHGTDAHNVRKSNGDIFISLLCYSKQRCSGWFARWNRYLCRFFFLWNTFKASNLDNNNNNNAKQKPIHLKMSANIITFVQSDSWLKYNKLNSKWISIRVFFQSESFFYTSNALQYTFLFQVRSMSLSLSLFFSYSSIRSLFGRFKYFALMLCLRIYSWQNVHIQISVSLKYSSIVSSCDWIWLHLCVTRQRSSHFLSYFVYILSHVWSVNSWFVCDEWS